jgi:hypothetical protein
MKLMDYGISDIRTELQNLRQRVYHGELLDSLGTEVGHLIDQLDQDPATPVKQLTPEETQPLYELLSDLQGKMMAGEPVLVSDKELLTLLNGLRQTDPELRDRGVFYFVSDGLQQGVFTDDQIVLMARYLLQDNVLLSHLGEMENDGVFLRSFAAFILGMLVYANRQSEVDLFDDMLHEALLDQVATLIAMETDGRGFAGEKGWAHIFMHIANLLDEIAADPKTPRADKLFLLTILVERLKRLRVPLVMGENRRIVSYFTHLINMHEIYAQYFLRQLKQWRQEMTRRPQPESEADWHQFYNQTRLLQALMIRDNLPKDIFDYLNEARNFLA